MACTLAINIGQTSTRNGQPTTGNVVITNSGGGTVLIRSVNITTTGKDRHVLTSVPLQLPPLLASQTVGGGAGGPQPGLAAGAKVSLGFVVPAGAKTLFAIAITSDDSNPSASISLT